MKTVKTDAVVSFDFFFKMSFRKELFVSYFDENTIMSFHFVKDTPLLPITYWTISWSVKFYYFVCTRNARADRMICFHWLSTGCWTFNLHEDSVTQTVQFMNEAFIPFDSHHNAVYGLQQWTTKGIDRSVSLYTDSFDSKSLKDFTTWYGQKKLYFFKAKVRKRQTSEKATVSNQRRFSCIMKQHFLCDIKLSAS